MKKTYISKSKIQGKGLMAEVNLQPGETIGMSHVNGSPTKDIGLYYNHSDSPNSYSQLIDGNRYILPLRPIAKGEEITLDYRQQPELEQPENFSSMKKKQLGGPNVTDTSGNTYMNKTQDFISWIQNKASQANDMHMMPDGSMMMNSQMQFGGNFGGPDYSTMQNYISMYNTLLQKYKGDRDKAATDIGQMFVNQGYSPSTVGYYHNQMNQLFPQTNYTSNQNVNPNIVQTNKRNPFVYNTKNNQNSQNTQGNTTNTNINPTNTQVTTQQNTTPNYYTYQGDPNQGNSQGQYSYQGMPQQQYNPNYGYNPNNSWSGLMQFLPLQFQPFMQGKINVNYKGNPQFGDQPQVLNQPGNYADIQYRHPIWGSNIPKRIRFGFGFGNDPITSGKANYIDPNNFGQSTNKTKTIGLRPGQEEYGKDPMYDEEIRQLAEENAMRNMGKFNKKRKLMQYGGNFYWQDQDILVPDDGDRIPDTIIPVNQMMPVMMTTPSNLSPRTIQPIGKSNEKLSTEDWFTLYHQNPNDPRLGNYKVLADTQSRNVQVPQTTDLSTEDWFKLYHENPNDPRLGEYKVLANTEDRLNQVPTTTTINPVVEDKADFDSMSFNSAFGAARKQGLKTFMWRGKSYGTRLKGETKYGYSKANIGENQFQYGGPYSSQPYTVEGTEFGTPGYNPYALAYDPFSTQQIPQTNQPDVFTMDPNQNQPAFDDQGNAKQPLYTYNGPSGDIQGDIKFKQRMTGESAANLALTGIDFATYLANQNAMNDASKKMRQQFQDVTNIYQPTDDMNRGDWFSLGLKQGAFRPNQENFAGPYAFAQYGGPITNGDEMYLTDEQIQQILDAGGDIEFID